MAAFLQTSQIKDASSVSTYGQSELRPNDPEYAILAARKVYNQMMLAVWGLVLSDLTKARIADADGK